MADDFYKRLDDKERHERIVRLFRNRPENLHDYQGCANDEARKSAEPSPELDAAPPEDKCPHCGEPKSAGHHVDGYCYAGGSVNKWLPVAEPQQASAEPELPPEWGQITIPGADDNPYVWVSVAQLAALKQSLAHHIAALEQSLEAATDALQEIRDCTLHLNIRGMANDGLAAAAKALTEPRNGIAAVAKLTEGK